MFDSVLSAWPFWVWLLTVPSELRAKISSHHGSHPLAKQRKDFLAVNAATPLEHKAHFTHEVVGAAAAYEAFHAFENNSAHAENGSKVTHARAKEVRASIIIWIAENAKGVVA